MAKKVKSAAPNTGVVRWRDAIDGERETSSKKSTRRGGVDKKQVMLLVFSLALCVVSAIGFTPLSERVSEGFDVQGGENVTLTATRPDGGEPTTEDMSSAVSIVESRVDALGVPGVVVRGEGDAIALQVPGSVDASSIVEDACRVGRLELVRLDKIGDAEALSKIMAGGSGVELEAGSYTAFLDGSSVTRAEVSGPSGNDGYAVDVTFSADGARKFSDVTAELAGSSGRIAVVVDGVVRSAPAVQSRIDGGAVSISGGFSEGEAKALKASLDFGSLPVKLAETGVAPATGALGEGGLYRVVLAFAASTAAVAVFLLVAFRGLGMLAPASMVVEAVLYLGALALLSRFGSFALSLRVPHCDGARRGPFRRIHGASTRLRSPSSKTRQEAPGCLFAWTLARHQGRRRRRRCGLCRRVRLGARGWRACSRLLPCACDRNGLRRRGGRLFQGAGAEAALVGPCPEAARFLGRPPGRGRGRSSGPLQ